MPYTLEDLGDYYGDAGNPMLLNLDNDFNEFEGKFWWVPTDFADDGATLLTDSNLKWDSVEVKSVIMRVRAVADDEVVACPLIPMEDWWSSVIIDLPPSREPGAIISYYCDGDLMWGNEGHADERQSGTILCQQGEPSKPHTWNDTFALPCTLKCPPEFEKDTLELTCYHFSTEAAPLGLPEASKKCSEFGASLAVLQNPEDLNFADKDKFYYTAHTRQGATEVYPEVPEIFTCETTCTATEELECIAAGKDVMYRAQECSDPETRFLCMIPAWCPNNYTEHGGLCYKLLSDVRNFTEALVQCAEEGASLAYPETPSAIGFLTIMAMVSSDSDGMTLAAETQNLMIGLNDALGDWTSEGLYSPDEDVITLADISPSGSHWRFLTIDQSISTLTSTTLAAEGATGAICQLYGPLGCKVGPAEALANSTRVWDNTTAVASFAIYTCYPGYFVNGNESLTVQRVECLGPLGGWYPSELHNCIATEVCVEEVPAPPSSLITNTTTSLLRYLNGTVNFTCPENMTTQEGASLQTITCLYNESHYRFTPQVVQACDVCTREPVGNNSETDWDGDTTYTVNMTVTATCIENHVLNLTHTTSHLACTYEGWQSAPYCYPGCADAPPTPGSNMTRDNLTWNGDGVVLYYNCSSGYFIPPSEEYPELLTFTSVTCSATTWEPSGPPLMCAQMCLEDPMAASPTTNSSWDGVNRTVGTEVVFSCSNGQVLPDLNTSVTINCGADGNWTTVPLDYLLCRTVAPAPPPVAPGNSYIEPPPPYWVGMTIRYMCPSPQTTATGDTHINVTCLEEGWPEIDPTFECFAGESLFPQSLPY
ncbi:uncharacterized protein LOC121873877 isoform X2 [Homarus americanus]|uniref:uncharacterized protein LOC121873877 isoform X2 n=1 Tax=Homarus americanus TaxID=6706 RepID=UPI001C4426A0|nr:uncharacterized protein LOC121873877 isoform X2 [Homarus americanus]